ncbi:class I SAM-dependent methyltransferase [Candidatus Pacearchaeota archaeon]|nr:class I SAM-dependent methyltransferase [Candidatus Pacearchaeota archaeon]
MTKAIKKWWNDNAISFQKEHKVPLSISYGPWMPNETKLKLMGNLKGKKVLEIACGGAQCGITFAKKGAKVIGIDISEEQLKYAKELAQKNKVKIKLLQGDVTKLPQIKSNSQDIVFSSWAMFYIGNLKKCFKEVHRVLKKKGIFVFSTHHPFWENLDKKTMKVKRCYFDTGKYYKERHKKGMFGAYRHTISEFAEALYYAGFVIERILEPDPRKYKKHGTEIVPEAFKRKAMKKIPRTLIIKARK